MSIILWCLVIIIAYKTGWVIAHKVVAEECEELGKFYVGKKVFQCVKIDE